MSQNNSFRVITQNTYLKKVSYAGVKTPVQVCNINVIISIIDVLLLIFITAIIDHMFLDQKLKK